MENRSEEGILDCSSSATPGNLLTDKTQHDRDEDESTIAKELSTGMTCLDISKDITVSTPHLSMFIMLLLPKRLFTWTTIENRATEMKENLENKYGVNLRKEELVLEGSFAEGFNIPDAVVSSDPPRVVSFTSINCMVVSNEVMVSLNSPGNENGHCDIQMNLMDPPSLFVKLQIMNLNRVRRKLQLEDKYIVYDDTEGHYYLRNDFGNKANRFNTKRETYNESSMTSYPVELLPAFYCNQLPYGLQPWLERQPTNKWLSEDDIHTIETLGFHVTSHTKGNGGIQDADWLISFCAAESYISKTAVTTEQRRCFVCLKLLYMLTLQGKCFLTSYHMKTVFLQACNSLQVEQWTYDPGACLMYMLDYLFKCVREKRLPHFFLKDVNLMNRVEVEEFRSAELLLQTLRSDVISPLLEFSDTTVFGMQCSCISLRSITEALLADMRKVSVHENVQDSSADVFTWTAFYIAHMLMKEEHPLKVREAVNYLIEIHPFLVHCDNSTTSLCNFIDGLGFRLDNVQQSIKFYEEALDRAHDHPELLNLRGNLACIYHSASYTFSAEPEVQAEVLGRAEVLFNAIFTENPSSATTIDYANYLCQQRKWKKAKETIENFVSNVNDVSLRTGYGPIEIDCVDDNLQEEIYCHDQIETNSLSFAYYYLTKCLLSLGSSDADMEKNLQTFQDHCDNLKCPKSFSLLAYSYKDAGKWCLAKKAFEKAVELDLDYSAAQSNISVCEAHMEKSNENQN